MYDPLEQPAVEQARQLGLLLGHHADTVARFGIGVAPSFKQELNRVIAREKGEDCDRFARPVEGVTGSDDSAL